MRNKTSHILFDYWNHVRDGRIAPQRIEIDPSELSKILSQTMILEVVEDTFVFRIAGTSICEFMGSELRGQDFLGLWRHVDRRGLRSALNKTLTSGCPTTVSITSHCRNGNPISSEILLLALYDHKGRLNRLLGCWSQENASLNLSMPSYRSTAHQIAAVKSGWPETDPSSLQPLEMPAPKPTDTTVLGNFRMRIVRRDRRQFGVLDGGLTD